MRYVIRFVLLAVGIAAFHGDAVAQKQCKKGIPCGNSCIAANKTCRIGTKATPSQSDTSSVREGSVDSGGWVASTRGKTYYMAGCSGAKRLSAANVIRFKTEDDAKKVGYHRSATKGC